MRIVKKGHPRHGAKVGDMVDGFACVGERFAVRDGDGGWLGPRDSIDEARRYVTCLVPSLGPYTIRRLTRWRRVRVKLRWVGLGLHPSDPANLPVLVAATEQLDLLDRQHNRWVPVPYPPHVINRRRFAERIARAYGYEVDRG